MLLQSTLVGLQQAFDTVAARLAGQTSQYSLVTEQTAIGQFAVQQQQVTAVLHAVQHLGAVGRLFRQLIHCNISADGMAQGNLYMQGNTGIGNLQLQFMPQHPHQLPTAKCIAEIIRIIRMEEDQAAAVHQGVQLPVTGPAGLFQLFTITFQQGKQARARQTVQGVQVAKAYCQHGGGRQGGFRCGGQLLQLIGKSVGGVGIVLLVGGRLPHS